MNRKQAYKLGYSHGYSACPYCPPPKSRAPTINAYGDGWFDGDADRLSSEELTLDPAKEQTNPLEYGHKPT